MRGTSASRAWDLDAARARAGTITAVTVLLVGAALIEPARAASRSQCRQACQTMITACAQHTQQFADVGRACKRAVMKRCRRNGPEACSGAPPVCGDGSSHPSEACDGGDLGGATCQALGYASGALSCTEQCRFDVGGCVGGIQGTSLPRSCVEAGAGSVGCTAEIIE
jgi:hypothetical protein